MFIKSLLLLVCITSSAYSQDKLLGILPLENGKVTYNQVVTIDTVSQSELHTKAKKWLAQYYYAKSTSIQFDENAELIASVSMTLSWVYMTVTPIQVHFTLSVQTKDSKYRVIANGFKLNSEAIEYWSNLKREENSKKFFATLDKEIQFLLNDLKASMSKKDTW